MKVHIEKSNIIVAIINIFVTSLLFLLLTYLKHIIGGFIIWELIKWGYILIMTLVVTVLTNKLKMWNFLMIFLLVGTIIGNELGTFYWYNYVSGDFATPLVGMLFEIICALIIIVLIVVVNIRTALYNREGNKNE